MTKISNTVKTNLIKKEVRSSPGVSKESKATANVKKILKEKRALRGVEGKSKSKSEPKVNSTKKQSGDNNNNLDWKTPALIIGTALLAGIVIYLGGAVIRNQLKFLIPK